MTFRVRIDARATERVMRRLETAFPRKWLAAQARRSVTREINQTHRFMVKKAGPVAGLTAKNLRKRIGKFTPKRGRAGGTIWVTRRSTRIAADEWTTRRLKKGYRARGRQGAGSFTFDNAFQWDKNGKKLWRRKGKERLPIERIYLERQIGDVLRTNARLRMRGAPARIYRHMRQQLIKRARRQATR